MKTTFSIRATTVADLGRIDALLGRSYPVLLKDAYPPSLLVMAVPLISKAQPHLVASGTYFIVEEAARALAAGGWTKAAPGEGQAMPNTGHIRHFVTDHTQVRRGIGRALMDYILADAYAAGIVRMECLSTLMAVPFYAACGFKERRPISIPLRPGIEFPAVLMDLAL